MKQEIININNINKKNLKNEKGITLIVLVITIVILLILAGIALIQLTGEEGIITKAKQAKKIQIEVEMKEQLILAISELQIEKLGKATLEDITQEWIENKITQYENTITNNPSIINEKYVKMKKEGIIKEFIIDEKLNVIEKGAEVLQQYEIGQYVKYDINGYTNWIIAGESDNGQIMLVSVGSTEIYKLNGASYNEYCLKLDEYCNENYVDTKFATKSESYSTAKNIKTTNSLVYYGEIDERTSEIDNGEYYYWFFDNNVPHASGVQVINFQDKTKSYVVNGRSCHVRPVIYLRYGIKYKNGDGTKENPYELVENSGKEI